MDAVREVQSVMRVLTPERRELVLLTALAVLELQREVDHEGEWN